MLPFIDHDYDRVSSTEFSFSRVHLSITTLTNLFFHHLPGINTIYSPYHVWRIPVSLPGQGCYLNVPPISWPLRFQILPLLKNAIEIDVHSSKRVQISSFFSVWLCHRKRFSATSRILYLRMIIRGRVCIKLIIWTMPASICTTFSIGISNIIPRSFGTPSRGFPDLSCILFWFRDGLSEEEGRRENSSSHGI